MSIPLDKLIDFNKNEFELCNAVEAETRKIFQKSKVASQTGLEDAEEIVPRAAAKLASQAFEEILLGRVKYHRPEEET